MELKHALTIKMKNEITARVLGIMAEVPEPDMRAFSLVELRMQRLRTSGTPLPPPLQTYYDEGGARPPVDPSELPLREAIFAQIQDIAQSCSVVVTAARWASARIVRAFQ